MKSQLFVNASNISRLIGLKVTKIIKYTFLRCTGVISVVYKIGSSICSTFVSLKGAQQEAVNLRKQNARSVKLISYNPIDSSKDALAQGSSGEFYYRSG